MLKKKKEKELNDRTHTRTEPYEVYEAGPYFEQADALKGVPGNYAVVRLEKRDDGWYVTAVRGFSTSTVTTTYYPWSELKPPDPRANT